MFGGGGKSWWSGKGESCAGCGGPIMGAYIEAMGQSWHPEHFICGICRHAISGAFFVEEGQPAHEACVLGRRPKCRDCARPIQGRYREDLWGERSCEACFSKGLCLYCGGAGERDARSSDILCKVCRRLAIHEQRMANAFYGEVVDWARSKRLFEGVKQPPMVLYPRERLLREFPGSHRTLGVAEKSVWETPAGASVRADRVVVVAGLPAPLFQAVAAHELGHVWVAANNIHNMAPLDEEGFCELLSHTWISERGTFGREGLLRSIEASNDPIYGEGFRKMKSIEQRSNINFVMRLIKLDPRRITY